jgi:protein-S-isoprenylcysteine O-methyltransferase Ste14
MPLWLPLAAASTFVLLGLGVRSAVQRVRHGTFGIVLFAGDGKQHARDAGLLLLLASLFGQAVAVLALGRRPEELVVALPGVACWPRTGALLAAVGTALLFASQLQLGGSWRIGIDEGARPGLVDHGFYRHCRNPIFSGMLLFLCGYLLLMPTWLSLLQLVLAAIGIHLQVRAEEAWLLRTYGDAWRTYAARVGRFVPGLGRLRR